MEEKKDIYILGIESSCDDTSAAVLKNGVLLSNVTASQEVHRAYGGVVPELASRAHQQNVVPVVDQAIARAGIRKEDLSAVAFTRGPGLMGSLLVGVSFAKGFARSLNIPMIDVNHLQGHVMAHFIKESDDDQSAPPFPFICLLVSGGNSQIVKVNAYNDMEVLGQTIDDAAGEAIDKCAKVLEWGYPGGPVVDKYARQGNPKAFSFAEPHIPGLNYSFSGFKTSFLYSLRKWVAADPDFVEKNKFDLAASIEFTIVDILMKKLRMAVKQTGIKHVAVAGGVSANNGLRNALCRRREHRGLGVKLGLLRHIGDAQTLLHTQAAVVRLCQSAQDLQQRRLARSVAPYEAHTFSGLQRKACVIQQGYMPERQLGFHQSNQCHGRNYRRWSQCPRRAHGDALRKKAAVWDF